MPNGRQRDPAVQRALDLLSSGRAETVSAAARATGASRTTVRDNWHGELGTTQQAATDELDEIPEESLIPVFVRDYSHLSELYVYPLGDLHVGAGSFQRARFEQWMSYLLNREETSMLNTGDNFNAAILGSVSDVYSETMTVRDARRFLQGAFKPLAEAGRIDALGKGNHENRIYKATGDEPGEIIAENLGVNYWNTAAVLRYLVGDIEYVGFVRHGSGGGSTIGAKANRLQKQRNTFPDADFYVSGHTHTQLTFPEDVLRLNAERSALERQKQCFISSGSFLGMEAYAVENGMAPTHVGAPRIRLDGRRKDPHVSV